MNVLSLFSGIGGFDLGLKQAGFYISAMCEIDKNAQKILLRNFSNAKLYDDVRDLNFNKGDFDVVCGGFPCQDVSRSGKRTGLAGERSGLWYEFKRIIDDVEPKWVIIENVQGLLSSADGRDFATIIQWLAERGYGVGWRVLDSSRFGLAQRRKRVFIVASLRSRSGCELLFKHEGVEWTPRKSGKKDEAYARVDYKEDKKFVNSVVYGINNQSPFMTVMEEKSHTLSTKTIESILWETNHEDSFTRIGLRRLTPVECERLQGFPDNWTLGNSNRQRYKQLGNAVSVPVIKWIGTKIMEIEGRVSNE